MKISDYLNVEDKWLLAIIDLAPYIEGRTRLQKFGILSFYEILNNEKFFDDWEPGHYGGFSLRLATSLTKLESYGHIQSDEIIIKAESTVSRYSLTESGKNLISDFVDEHSSELEKIKSIIFNYLQKPLDLLLHDVYQKYPELTVNSKIRADINKIATENHSYLSSKYEIISDKSENIPIFTVASQQHVFGDEDFREKLARSIGLKKIPDLDPQSFERIKGILSEKIDTEHFDADELVKEVRGC